MKKLNHSIPALCAALALTGSAWAQAQTQAAPPKAQTDKQEKTMGKPGKMMDEKKMKIVRGSKTIGAKLFNQNGEHLGEINDVIFDENTGAISHGILAIGGWLGVGDKLSAVPWKFIKQSDKNANEFVVNVEKSKLTAGEHFADNNWPEMNAGWYEKNYTSYGLTGTTKQKLVRASKVDDADLFNREAEDIGEITDVLLDPNAGKVCFGVVSLDKYESVGDKLTTIPWSLIRQSEKATKGYVVNVEKSKLESAPHFEADAWPDFTDPAYNTRTYQYYGVSPDRTASN